jgi:hypothetical protein
MAETSFSENQTSHFSTDSDIQSCWNKMRVKLLHNKIGLSLKEVFFNSSLSPSTYKQCILNKKQHHCDIK